MPLWRSMASTRVVLPWSTWAMIAILRMGGLAEAVIVIVVRFFGSGAALPSSTRKQRAGGLVAEGMLKRQNTTILAHPQGDFGCEAFQREMGSAAVSAARSGDCGRSWVVSVQSERSASSRVTS